MLNIRYEIFNLFSEREVQSDEERTRRHVGRCDIKGLVCPICPQVLIWNIFNRAELTETPEASSQQLVSVPDRLLRSYTHSTVIMYSLSSGGRYRKHCYTLNTRYWLRLNMLTGVFILRPQLDRDRQVLVDSVHMFYESGCLRVQVLGTSLQIITCLDI